VSVALMANVVVLMDRGPGLLLAWHAWIICDDGGIGVRA
jgi:hypothetical protein